MSPCRRGPYFSPARGLLWGAVLARGLHHRAPGGCPIAPLPDCLILPYAQCLAPLGIVLFTTSCSSGIGALHHRAPPVCYACAPPPYQLWLPGARQCMASRAASTPSWAIPPSVGGCPMWVGAPCGGPGTQMPPATCPVLYAPAPCPVLHAGLAATPLQAPLNLLDEVCHESCPCALLCSCEGMYCHTLNFLTYPYQTLRGLTLPAHGTTPPGMSLPEYQFVPSEATTPRLYPASARNSKKV